MDENDISEFMEWNRYLGQDDRIYAFKCIKAIAYIDFELRMRTEGYLERIEDRVVGLG